jgi:hypothetical protein
MTSSRKGRKIELFLVAGEQTRGEQPHEALANLRGEEKSVKALVARWGELLASGKAKSLNLQVRHGQAGLLGDYLAPELELQQRLRDAWRGDEAALQYIRNSVTDHMATTWEFRRGRIEVAADDLWSTVCILFLCDHAVHKTAICANPDCQSPYFIKKRATQKYCESGPCTEYAQRQYALKWWNRTGKQIRSKQARRKPQ